MKIIALLLFCLFAEMSFAQQTSSYQKDLESLYQSLKKTQSFAEQITGAKRVTYLNGYETLKQAVLKPTAFDTLYHLSMLLWPVKDNHLGLYERPNPGFQSLMSADTTAIRKYLESGSFKRYPVAVKNVDSLERELSSRPVNEVEGIYTAGKLKIGIYATTSKDSLIGVVLSGNSALWQPGEMMVLLKQYAPGRFRGIYSNMYTKDLIFIKSDKFTGSKLIAFGSKTGISDQFSSLGWKSKKFELKTLDEGLQYLRLGSFFSSTKALLESTEFYRRIKDSLTSKKLIVDLRNNPGGGFKSSAQFLFLLKKYAKKGKIYVIINAQTYSNAEQFTLELKKFGGVLVLGEASNGTITYGNNYGKAVDLPSGKYKLYPTDMKDSGHYLPYEEIGVTPDVALNEKSDWIQQVKELISKED